VFIFFSFKIKTNVSIDFLIESELGYTPEKKDDSMISEANIHFFSHLPYIERMYENPTQKKQIENKFELSLFVWLCAPDEILKIDTSNHTFQQIYNIKKDPKIKKNQPYKNVFFCSQTVTSDEGSTESLSSGIKIFFKTKEVLGKNKIDLKDYINKNSENFFEENLKKLNQIIGFLRISPTDTKEKRRPHKFPTEKKENFVKNPKQNSWSIKENYEGFFFFSLLTGLKVTFDMQHCFSKKLNDFFEQMKPKSFYFILKFKLLKFAFLNNNITKIPKEKLFCFVVGFSRNKIGIEFNIDFLFIVNYFKNFFKHNELWPKNQSGMAYFKSCLAAIGKSIIELLLALQGVAPGFVIKIKNHDMVIVFDPLNRCVYFIIRVCVLRFSEKPHISHAIAEKQKINGSFM